MKQFSMFAMLGAAGDRRMVAAATAIYLHGNSVLGNRQPLFRADAQSISKAMRIAVG